jgi:hypothetical protein
MLKLGRINSATGQNIQSGTNANAQKSVQERLALSLAIPKQPQTARGRLQTASNVSERSHTRMRTVSSRDDSVGVRTPNAQSPDSSVAREQTSPTAVGPNKDGTIGQRMHIARESAVAGVYKLTMPVPPLILVAQTFREEVDEREFVCVLENMYVSMYENTYVYMYVLVPRLTLVAQAFEQKNCRCCREQVADVVENKLQMLLRTSCRRCRERVADVVENKLQML